MSENDNRACFKAPRNTFPIIAVVDGGDIVSDGFTPLLTKLFAPMIATCRGSPDVAFAVIAERYRRDVILKGIGV